MAFRHTPQPSISSLGSETTFDDAPNHIQDVYARMSRHINASDRFDSASTLARYDTPIPFPPGEDEDFLEKIPLNDHTTLTNRSHPSG